jgi:hypothetical protein
MAIFPIKLQTYTHRTALFVALIRNQIKEKRKMISDSAILMIMALAKKRLERPCLGEILNFPVSLTHKIVITNSQI